MEKVFRMRECVDIVNDLLIQMGYEITELEVMEPPFNLKNDNRAD